MKIIYVAAHARGMNDDEGAITYALRQLGHEVQPCREVIGRKALKLQPADLLLFHKWSDWDTVKKFECPKAFWYFDLVDWPSDPTLARRCQQRKEWMSHAIPLVDVGFCTDGDWVERWNSDRRRRDHRVGDEFRGGDGLDKLVTLRQGADERVVGRGKERRCDQCEHLVTDYDVLMVGIAKGGGQRRESFVRELRERYGDRFKHVEGGVYGRDLADLVARSKVVVCPDSPVTERYWSNRVYVMAGFGAVLFHPGEYLMPNNLPGVIYYQGREDLFDKIDRTLPDLSYQEELRRRNLADSISNHLYRHRCEELVRIVKERTCQKTS